MVKVIGIFAIVLVYCEINAELDNLQYRKTPTADVRRILSPKKKFGDNKSGGVKPLSNEAKEHNKFTTGFPEDIKDPHKEYVLRNGEARYNNDSEHHVVKKRRFKINYRDDECNQIDEHDNERKKPKKKKRHHHHSRRKIYKNHNSTRNKKTKRYNNDTKRNDMEEKYNEDKYKTHHYHSGRKIYKNHNSTRNKKTKRYNNDTKRNDMEEKYNEDKYKTHHYHSGRKIYKNHNSTRNKKTKRYNNDTKRNDMEEKYNEDKYKTHHYHSGRKIYKNHNSTRNKKTKRYNNDTKRNDMEEKYNEDKYKTHHYHSGRKIYKNHNSTRNKKTKRYNNDTKRNDMEEKYNEDKYKTHHYHSGRKIYKNHNSTRNKKTKRYNNDTKRNDMEEKYNEDKYKTHHYHSGRKMHNNDNSTRNKKSKRYKNEDRNRHKDKKLNKEKNHSGKKNRDKNNSENSDMSTSHKREKDHINKKKHGKDKSKDKQREKRMDRNKHATRGGLMRISKMGTMTPANKHDHKHNKKQKLNKSKDKQRENSMDRVKHATTGGAMRISRMGMMSPAYKNHKHNKKQELQKRKEKQREKSKHTIDTSKTAIGIAGLGAAGVAALVEKPLAWKSMKELKLQSEEVVNSTTTPKPPPEPVQEQKLVKLNKRERSNLRAKEKIRVTKMIPFSLNKQEDEGKENLREKSEGSGSPSAGSPPPNLSPYAITAQMELLMKEFPTVNATVTKVGRTVEYNEIVLVRVTAKKPDDAYFRAKESKYVDETPEKKIIFIVHGLTVMGLKDMTSLVKSSELKLLLSYYFKHLDKFDFFLMPLANPDGYSASFSGLPGGPELGSSMRAVFKTYVLSDFWGSCYVKTAKPFTDINVYNVLFVLTKADRPIWNKNVSPQSVCPGVFVDRNFDVAWDHTKEVSSCSQLYPGATPFSEEESKVVRDIFHHFSHKILAYIHVHAGTFDEKVFKGDAILYPRGYVETQSDDDKYIDIKAEVDEAMKNASFRVMSATVDTLSNWYGVVTGSSVDYAASVFGISYAMEFVMQLYDSESLNNNALTEIWSRLIDATFNKIWNSQQGGSDARKFGY